MRNLLICDDCKPEEVVPLCREKGYGIEVQAFYDPAEYERDPDLVDKTTKLIEGISLISMHGCFGDLCPGSCKDGG